MPPTETKSSPTSGTLTAHCRKDGGLGRAAEAAEGRQILWDLKALLRLRKITRSCWRLMQEAGIFLYSACMVLIFRWSIGFLAAAVSRLPWRNMEIWSTWSTQAEQ